MSVQLELNVVHVLILMLVSPVWIYFMSRNWMMGLLRGHSLFQKKAKETSSDEK